MTPPKPLRGSPPGGHTRRPGEAGSVGVAGMACSAASSAIGGRALPAVCTARIR